MKRRQKSLLINLSSIFLTIENLTLDLTNDRTPNHLIWIIHEPRLLQMQGTGHEVVVLHYECPVTKQMP